MYAYRWSIFNYSAFWSKKDQRWVGICDEFPNLFVIALTKDRAVNDIINLVDYTILDNKDN